jgi:flagellar hook-associated protein 2
MADIFVPGVKSRFDTDKMIESLMAVERLPKTRIEENVSKLQAEKTYWQELGVRLTSLRDGARNLYSFQNPFNDRSASSADESVLTALATREAYPEKHDFIIKQTAEADRFLSSPLKEDLRVDAGKYTFSTGEKNVSFEFKGGTLREFSNELNKRGEGVIGSRIIAVRSKTQSFLVESFLTGEDNRLVFHDAALSFAVKTGIIEEKPESVGLQDSSLKEDTGSLISERTISIRPVGSPEDSDGGSVFDDEVPTLLVKSGAEAKVLLDKAFNTADGLVSDGKFALKFEAAVKESFGEDGGRAKPEAGNYTAEISVYFADGTKRALGSIELGLEYSTFEFQLDGEDAGKAITSAAALNQAGGAEVLVRRIALVEKGVAVQDSGLDIEPLPPEQRPLNPVSTAKDAIILMDGIEVYRANNTIDDLVPGVTLQALQTSTRPVNIGIDVDNSSVKDAIISLVGNYNRLLAELNVLTRTDDAIVRELSYLGSAEQEAMRAKLGAFAGDSSLTQLRSRLVSAMSGVYRNADGSPLLASDFGIASDVRRGGSFDASRMRGYMEIDEKVLDAAIATNLPRLKELFGRDTDGDLIVDSGIAYALDQIVRPWVEIGGTLSGKTGAIDTKVTGEQRRIATLDRQLERKEQTLKTQYAQMESAFSNMERMQGSLDNFSNQGRQ